MRNKLIRAIRLETYKGRIFWSREIMYVKKLILDIFHPSVTKVTPMSRDAAAAQEEMISAFGS